MSFINIDWDFELLQELFDARGSSVIHETGVACTCRNEDAYAGMIEVDGAPASVRSLSCSKCQGDGYIYRNARIIRGLITAVQSGKNRQLIDAGYANPGDAIFSPDFEAGLISDFDKITFLAAVPLHEGQVILRNAANIKENKMLETDLTPDEDRLWYMADCALWCEDYNGVIYEQNVDFVLEDRKIRWMGNRPNDKVLYTLKYIGFPEWIVYNTPMARVDRDRSLAQKVVLQKKHVAFNTGSFNDTPVKRQADQVIFTTRSKI